MIDALEKANAELAKANEELRSARDELQRANERFGVVAQWIPVPIAITRKATGKVMYANDHFAKMFGLTSGSDLSGHPITDFFFDPADRAAMLQILDRQGELNNYEIRYKKADGSPLWGAAYLHYLTYNGEPAVFGALLDISERKQRSEELERCVGERTAKLERTNEELRRAHEAFQESEQSFRELAEAIPVPIALSRKATGQVIYANDHFAKMYGLTRGSDLLGRVLTDFYFDPAERLKSVRMLEQQGYISDLELRVKKADGTPFWVNACCRYLVYKGEEVFFGALMDISERKERSEELERRVRERTAELEAARDGALAADRAKNEFLANVSHELRNPLNHINGYCELLEQAATRNGHEYLLPDLRETRSSAKSLSKLVDDILDLTKMGAHNVRVEPRELPVAEFVNELARSVTQEVQKNANKLEVRCDKRAGSMWTDPDRLRQILTNLLGNACKFTEHGTITLSVNRETRQNQDWLAFTVADTGIGMSPEEISRLFTPFQQANSEIGRKYGGTGLGLALSQGYCTVLGGKISVESELGKGSRFTVRLPAVSAAKAVPITPQVQALRSSGNLVLVIDDDPKVHELMNRFVGANGFRIHSAQTGLEGLKLAKELRPAAITLDTLMPDLTGWEVLRLLKADKDTVDIPVIMLTVVDDKTKGYELGASEFVTKPVEWNHVAAILGKYCTVDSATPTAPQLPERKTR